MESSAIQAFTLFYNTVTNTDGQLIKLITNFTNLQQTYQPSTIALYVALIICFIIGAISFIKSTIQDNYSQIDMLWSILPWFYIWIFVYYSNFNLRLLIIGIFSLLWGIRLTYNFSRKGGYSGHEDYRWAYLRKAIPNKILWVLFNFFFISFYQSFLLLSFVMPAWTALNYTNVPINNIDLFAAVIMISLLILEATTDEQQWIFQNQKKYYANLTKQQQAELKDVDNDIKLGFVTNGLFSFSRHPNFFAEQLIWFTLNLFSYSCTGKYIHWTIVGSILLILLFQGSTTYTENISSNKYPAYKIYQQRVSRFIPLLPKSMEDVAFDGTIKKEQ